MIHTTATQIEAVERGIGQTENLISFLLGSPPSDQPAAAGWTRFLFRLNCRPGMPSALLERRPDIRAAEQNLIAANAQIGAARALYFPQISLTAFAGGQSRALTEIATAPARVYSLAPSALMPIFRAGQIRNQVRLTEAQQRELLVTYEQSIYNALREVSDALIGYSRTRSQRAEQEQLVRLSRTRFGYPLCAIRADWIAIFRCSMRNGTCSRANSGSRNCVWRNGSLWSSFIVPLGGGWQ